MKRPDQKPLFYFIDEAGDPVFYVDVLPQAMTGEPCLQVADYMLWALQRAYNKGETRYLDYIKERIAFIWDIYDTRAPRKLNRYHSRNRFDLNKISPL